MSFLLRIILLCKLFRHHYFHCLLASFYLLANFFLFLVEYHLRLCHPTPGFCFRIYCWFQSLFLGHSSLLLVCLPSSIVLIHPLGLSEWFRLCFQFPLLVLFRFFQDPFILSVFALVIADHRLFLLLAQVLSHLFWPFALGLHSFCFLVALFSISFLTSSGFHWFLP